MTIAHAAAGVVVAGITASGVWQTEVIRTMKPGDRAEVAGYTIGFAGVREVSAGNYLARRGHFIVSEGGVAVDTLWPEKRGLPAATHTDDRSGDPGPRCSPISISCWAIPTGGAAMRCGLYHNPLVPWIWIGRRVHVPRRHDFADRPAPPGRRPSALGPTPAAASAESSQ